MHWVEVANKRAHLQSGLDWNGCTIITAVYSYCFRKSLQCKEDTPTTSASPVSARERQLEEGTPLQHPRKPRGTTLWLHVCVCVWVCSDESALIPSHVLDWLRSSNNTEKYIFQSTIQYDPTFSGDKLVNYKIMIIKRWKCSSHETKQMYQKYNIKTKIPRVKKVNK